MRLRPSHSSRSGAFLVTLAFGALGALGLITGSGCSNSPNQNNEAAGSGGGGGTQSRDYKAPTNKRVKPPKRTTGRHATATFAAGCFWCVEAIFEYVKGVDEAVSGYSGGPEKKPSYGDVARGKTGHTEAVQVHYDPDAISYETLVRVLVGSMDPTQVNGQGPDTGRQYRSAIFFHDNEQKDAALKVLAEVRTQYKKPLAIEVAKLDVFWPAEDYHQDYELKNPRDSYIVAVSIPRLNAFKKKFPELVRH